MSLCGVEDVSALKHSMNKQLQQLAHGLEQAAARQYKPLSDLQDALAAVTADVSIIKQQLAAQLQAGVHAQATPRVHSLETLQSVAPQQQQHHQSLKSASVEHNHPSNKANACGTHNACAGNAPSTQDQKCVQHQSDALHGSGNAAGITSPPAATEPCPQQHLVGGTDDVSNSSAAVDTDQAMSVFDHGCAVVEGPPHDTRQVYQHVCVPRKGIAVQKPQQLTFQADALELKPDTEVHAAATDSPRTTAAAYRFHKSDSALDHYPAWQAAIAGHVAVTDDNTDDMQHAATSCGKQKAVQCSRTTQQHQDSQSAKSPPADGTDEVAAIAGNNVNQNCPLEVAKLPASRTLAVPLSACNDSLNQSTSGSAECTLKQHMQHVSTAVQGLSGGFAAVKQTLQHLEQSVTSRRHPTPDAVPAEPAHGGDAHSTPSIHILPVDNKHTGHAIAKQMALLVSGTELDIAWLSSQCLPVRSSTKAKCKPGQHAPQQHSRHHNQQAILTEGEQAGDRRQERGAGKVLHTVGWDTTSPVDQDLLGVDLMALQGNGKQLAAGAGAASQNEKGAAVPKQHCDQQPDTKMHNGNPKQQHTADGKQPHKLHANKSNTNSNKVSTYTAAPAADEITASDKGVNGQRISTISTSSSTRAAAASHQANTPANVKAKSALMAPARHQKVTAKPKCNNKKKMPCSSTVSSKNHMDNLSPVEVTAVLDLLYELGALTTS